MIIGVLFGVFLGLLEACVGAWKDTLFEPFEPLKFIRSPIVVSAWALIIGLWLFPSAHWWLIGVSAVSMERITVEAWKAALRKAPGKFKRANRDNGWLIERLTSGRSDR